MTDSTDPLVAAAVRPLVGDWEMKAAAIRLLESLREERPDQTQTALRRWDAPVREKRRMSWRWIFHLTVAIISILFLTQATLDFLHYRKAIRTLSGHTPEMISSSHFDAREKLLLKISDSNQSSTELAKALWDSDPANPAYYAEYCAAYVADTSKLPADFLEQAQRVDPNNAFFPYWAAAVEAKDAAKQRSLTKAMKAAGTPHGWDVTDESKVDRALHVLSEARNLADYRPYEVQMARERISILPQNTPREYINSVLLLVTASTTHQYSRDLPNAIAAKAWLCSERSDTQGFRGVKESADIYLRNVCRSEPGFIIHDMILEIAARVILKNLTAAAVKLGLIEEAAEIQARLDRFEKLITDRKAGVFEIEGKDAHRKAGVINGDALPYLSKRALHPPILTDRDVKPGRMLEHDILWQICTYGTWALLGITAALAALYRFRSPRVVREVSARMELLLWPVDWVWLCLVSISPFIYCLLITRLTPMGGSESNILTGPIKLPYDGVVLLPMAQFTGLFLMMLILPILIARWRLGKRAAFFGFGKARLWPGAIAFISAAAAIPVLGWGVTRESEVALMISWGLLVIPLAWILVAVIHAMTAGANQLLQLTTTARVLVPAYSAAMLVLLTSTPFYMMSRQRWFEQDTMNHLDAAYPSLSKFEYQLSVAARKELREALGYQ